MLLRLKLMTVPRILFFRGSCIDPVPVRRRPDRRQGRSDQRLHHRAADVRRQIRRILVHR